MIAPEPRAESTSVWPAILQVVCGVMLFSMSDTMAKYLREADLPAVEIAWVRYIVFVLFGLVVTGRRRFTGLWPRRPWLQVLRGLTLLGSSVFFIAGLSFLPLAEAAALSFVSPAFITALSVLILHEKVGVHRWGATLVGLLGVLIVIRPGSSALQMAALYPLSSAACWAAAMIVTRIIGGTDRSEATLLWSACTGLVVLTALLPLVYRTPTPFEVGLGIAIGVFSSGGQYLLILAYRRATASVLAPFSYIQLLSSATLGYVVFGALPDAAAFAGAAVIILSGMYIVYRERVRARQARAA